MPRGRRALRHEGRPPRKQQPEHVAQVVPRIRHQRERMREQTAHHLGNDESRIKRDAHGKRAPEARRRMGMPMAAVGVAVPVFMGMIPLMVVMLIMAVAHRR